ncbi:hypothetical protein KA111_01405 [Candidatus Woesebacteria bacterium]|nr:hypothetical protein [Candidatus Woesebacteria bacterium]
MTISEQIKAVVEELFKVSGFSEDQKVKMTDAFISMWLITSSIQIIELLSEEDQELLEKPLLKIKENPQDEEAQKEIFQLITNLDEENMQKAIEIIYDVAGSMLESMIEKFNLKSTDEQKQLFAQKVADVFGIKKDN